MDKDRTCNACGITKRLTEFHKRVDDFTKRCKECVNKAERLRYKLKSVEDGRYQCYDLDLDEIHDELSLPVLRALMHQHNIPIKAHSIKQELIDTLKQHGILPENYVSGLRRAVGTPLKTGKRLQAKTVELTDMSDGSVMIFPSLYKTARFLGTYNHNITKHNGLSYTSPNDKTYMIKIL
jgi:NUMOD1 domain